ncbi:MAG: fucose operon FucU protein, partial [Vallitaleaceae bacterium]|nr:fucose operon FucU protein [Vallitaleaceae bacterium]
IERYDDEKAFTQFEAIDRLPFYVASQNAFAIVTTATTARYANISLQKGVI